jgi:predicted GNAT family acetyltransferase
MAPASAPDRDLLLDWWVEFARDVDGRVVPVEAARATIDGRLAASEPSLYVWDHDGPVSMASARGPTPHGIRIGGVYTPRELRRRGYASACVASLGRRLMAEGRECCFLFTDARNPTSNRIYQAIGYELVTAISELVFDDAPAR